LTVTPLLQSTEKIFVLPLGRDKFYSLLSSYHLTQNLDLLLFLFVLKYFVLLRCNFVGKKDKGMIRNKKNNCFRFVLRSDAGTAVLNFPTRY
jgi:hypothetical protein